MLAAQHKDHSCDSTNSPIGVNPLLAGLDCETVWQDYWNKYGEYLLWEGWVAKYPDQIDYEKVQVVPAITEVEVETEKLDSEIGEGTSSQSGVVQVERISGQPDFIDRDKKDIADQKCERMENSQQKEEFVKNIETTTLDSSTAEKADNGRKEDKAPLSQDKEKSESSFGTDYHSPCSPLQYLSPNFKTIKGVEIVSTLQKRVEVDGDLDENIQQETEADNLSNQRKEMIDMMHSYTSSGSHCDYNESHTEETDQSIAPCDEEKVEYDREDFSKVWEDLWNEHYTETYWYYYNQFVEKFNRIAPSAVQGQKVYEAIAVVNENGELVIVDECNDGRTTIDVDQKEASEFVTHYNGDIKVEELCSISEIPFDTKHSIESGGTVEKDITDNLDCDNKSSEIFCSKNLKVEETDNVKDANRTEDYHQENTNLAKADCVCETDMATSESFSRKTELNDENEIDLTYECKEEPEDGSRKRRNRHKQSSQTSQQQTDMSGSSASNTSGNVEDSGL